MVKMIRKNNLRSNRQRKNIRKIPKGIIHIQASFTNIFITVTDTRGQVVSCCSAGTCGFKGKRKGTPFAAQSTVEKVIQTLDMQQAVVMIKGPGRGRNAALRTIRRIGIHLIQIYDVTPLPHNGCRPPKKRRV
uniref:Ribosomal protein S11 n=1 Tax=Monotropa uniflora TaxID=50148 RepID=A0A1B0ZEZ9_MONUN|nr:ribosomal protein S11 [Monotropa uniflora]ASN78995.1 ribosomal protein S11 [Monotropa uniflora]